MHQYLLEQKEDQWQKYLLLLLPDYGPLLGMEAQVEGNNHKPEEKATVMPLVGSNNMRITRVLSSEQRPHFHCVSCRVKSSLCRQPFKSVQKSGQINFKNGFFPVLDRFRTLQESCVADQSCRNFFIPVKLAPFDDRPDN